MSLGAPGRGVRALPGRALADDAGLASALGASIVGVSVAVLGKDSPPHAMAREAKRTNVLRKARSNERLFDSGIGQC
jgi:hypothetical protein